MGDFRGRQVNLPDGNIINEVTIYRISISYYHIISHYILPEGHGHFFKRNMMDDPLMTSRKRGREGMMITF
jgi:hypothetical protein